MKNMMILLLCILVFSEILISQNTNKDTNEIKLSNLTKDLNNSKDIEQFFNICRTLEQQGNSETALQYYKQLKELAENWNNKLITAKCYLRIGMYYTNKVQYKDALDNNQRALSILEKESGHDYLKIQADALNNNGTIFNNLGDYEKAVQFYQHSLDIAEKLSDSSRIEKAVLNIGSALLILNKLDKALEYFIKSYELTKSSKNKYLQAGSLYNIGIVYFQKKDYVKALEYYEEVLKTFQELNDNIQIGRILVWGGQIYSYLNQKEKALSLFHQGISLSNKVGDEFGVAFANLKLAEYYNEQKQFATSNEYSLISIDFFQKNNILSFMKENYNILSDSYFKLGMYKQSYEYLNKFSDLQDSLSKSDISDLISKYELSQQNEQNIQKIVLLKKNNEIKIVQKNNLLVLSLIILVALLIISILLYSRYRLKNKASKQLAELNATKDKFFTIISHDLKTPISSFNNLAEILTEYYNDFTEEEKLKHINSLKDSSAGILNLLENLLTWSRIQTEKIKANPEVLQLISIIDNEIQNQKQFAEKKKIFIKSEIQPTTYVFADKDMIGMVIRNLLSNAIKYTLENGSITISSNEDEEYIEIDINDNGVGIKDEDKTKLFILDVKHTTVGTSNEKGTGLGLNLCKEFIEKNRGKIWFDSQFGKGSTFKFTLPKAVIEDNI